MKLWIKNTLAGGVLVLGIGGTVAYSQWLSPYINDQRVFVASHDIQPNTVIGANDVTSVLVPTSIVEDKLVTNLSDIIGKMAAQNIAANQQFTKDDLENNALVPTGDDKIAPIISTWIAGMPQSLRRGDHVDIYIKPNATSGPGQANVALQSVASSDPILTDIPVEFVRNGSNQEITDAPPVTVGGGVLGTRQNGSANPSELELKVTTTQWDTLYRAILSQNQLIFLYTQSK